MTDLYITELSSASSGVALKAVRDALGILAPSSFWGTAYALELLKRDLPTLVGTSSDEDAILAACAALSEAGFEIWTGDTGETPEALRSPHFEVIDGGGEDLPEQEPVAGDDTARVALVLLHSQSGNPFAAVGTAASLSRAMGEDPAAPDAVMYEAAVLLADTFSGYEQANLVARIARDAGVAAEEEE